MGGDKLGSDINTAGFKNLFSLLGRCSSFISNDNFRLCGLDAFHSGRHGSFLCPYIKGQSAVVICCRFCCCKTLKLGILLLPFASLACLSTAAAAPLCGLVCKRPFLLVMDALVASLASGSAAAGVNNCVLIPRACSDASSDGAAAGEAAVCAAAAGSGPPGGVRFAWVTSAVRSCGGGGCTGCS